VYLCVWELRVCVCVGGGGRGCVVWGGVRVCGEGCVCVCVCARARGFSNIHRKTPLYLPKE
jgi:hypothetical protein